MARVVRSMSALASAVTVTALLAGSAPCGEAAAQSVDASPRPVKMVAVEVQPTTLRRVYPAIVLPAQEVELSFRVSGQIVDLPIRGALRVGKGDLVAQLDTRDFEAELARLTSRLAEASAQLRALTSGTRPEDLAVLEADVAAARAQLEAAESAADRSRALFEREVIAAAALDRDLTALTVAEAALEARRQTLRKARSGARQEEVAAQLAAVEGLELSVEAARANLADASLRAPFAGIIARRLVENFVNVQAKQPIAILHKLDTLTLSFDIPAPDVAALGGRGTPRLVADLDGLPGREFVARLAEFSTLADPATQTYRARATIAAPSDAAILPGMTGRIVATDSRAAVPRYTVPLAALASAPDGAPFVWVVDGAENRVSKRPVGLGEAVGASVEVVDGLTEGDVVVTAGISKLREGMRIRPISTVGK